MEIKISGKEIEILAQLIYLGNWIVNSMKKPEERITKYDKFFNKIIKQLNSPKKEISRNELHNEVEELIEQYNKDILFPAFSEEYANFKYPYHKYEMLKDEGYLKRQIISNNTFRRLCENELESNSFKNIEINIPNIEAEIAIELNKNSE